jgi:hypothetical protein
MDDLVVKVRARKRAAGGIGGSSSSSCEGAPVSSSTSSNGSIRSGAAGHAWVAIKQLSDADHVFVCVLDSDVRMHVASLSAVNLVVHEHAIAVQFPPDNPRPRVGGGGGGGDDDDDDDGMANAMAGADGAAVVFDVEDDNEYELFRDAVTECRLLEEYTLRLQVRPPEKPMPLLSRARPLTLFLPLSVVPFYIPCFLQSLARDVYYLRRLVLSNRRRQRHTHRRAV